MTCRKYHKVVLKVDRTIRSPDAGRKRFKKYQLKESDLTAPSSPFQAGHALVHLHKGRAKISASFHLGFRAERTSPYSSVDVMPLALPRYYRPFAWYLRSYIRASAPSADFRSTRHALDSTFITTNRPCLRFTTSSARTR